MTLKLQTIILSILILAASSFCQAGTSEISGFDVIPAYAQPEASQYYQKLIVGDKGYYALLYFDSEARRNSLSLQINTEPAKKYKSVRLISFTKQQSAGNIELGLILRFISEDGTELYRFHQWLKTADGWRCKPYAYMLP